MSADTPTAEEVVAGYREAVLEMVEPRNRAAAAYELDVLLHAARERRPVKHPGAAATGAEEPRCTHCGHDWHRHWDGTPKTHCDVVHCRCEVTREVILRAALRTVERERDEALAKLSVAEAEHDEEESGYAAAYYAKEAELDELRTGYNDAEDENEQLRAELSALREQVAGLRTVAAEAFSAWDSDQDSRVGKLLVAMCGETGIRPDLDALFASTPTENGHER